MNNELMRSFDVCIIGGGPAGMSAAARCAEGGSTVCLIDEQSTLGGQIYRNVSENKPSLTPILGQDYLRGRKLVERFQRSGALHIPRATLWRIDDGNVLYWSQDGKAHSCQAKHMIIATGAMERPFPFPGWTLPGVMTAGACQIMIKTAKLVPNDAVIVGTGPLVYLVASQLIDAGSPPKAIVDTQKPANYLAAIKKAKGIWQGKKHLVKGLKLLAKIRRAGIPHFSGVTDVAVTGNGEAEQLHFSTNGKPYCLDVRTVLTHIGVIPNVQLTRAMGLSHEWDPQQLCWRPEQDQYGQTSKAGVYIAGDGGGIGGAMVAELQGELCATATLNELGMMDAVEFEKSASRLMKQLQIEWAIRPFLDALYPPPEQALIPLDETIICRCEEVTAAQIREQAARVTGINQMKVFTRCGMGPCQGRYCGQTVANLMSEATGSDIEKIGYFRIRHPIKPLKLGELASLTPKKHSFLN